MQFLSLNNTQVADIAPLQNLPALQNLSLNNTQVADIAPLQNLPALQFLSLNNTQVADIAPLQNLPALQNLYLDNTQVADIAPLQNLAALQRLFLNNTQVADIAPLQNLPALQNLYLDNTQVADIAPLQNLAALQRLNLDNTQVADLRPLLALPALGDNNNEHRHLYFRATPATAAAPELHAFSEIEDDAERIDKTLAFLRTLPPYPKPLPWEKRDTPDDLPPELPTDIPAPITVAATNGRLQLINAPSDNDPDGQLFARQGWDAITNYLEDLADQRHRIDNALPRLGKSMQQLEIALGETYEDLNAIAAGTQGSRFIRLSRHAQTALMDEDADDIEEFATALALFLERFPEWRAYRDAALAAPIAPEAALQAAQMSQDIAEAFENYQEIDHAIPAAIDAQNEAVTEDPEDTITSTGLIASVGHVLSALGTASMDGFKWVRRQGTDIAKMTGENLKKLTAKAAATGISGVALAGVDIFLNNASALNALATQFPTQLGWLKTLLAFLGL